MKILSELQTRMKRLSDFRPLTEFFFAEVKDLDTELIVNPKMKVETLADAKKSLEVALEILKKDFDISSMDAIKEIFIEEIKNHEMKNGQVLWPVRVALSMEQFSPGALELVYIFGKEKSIERIQKILKQI